MGLRRPSPRCSCGLKMPSTTPFVTAAVLWAIRSPVSILPSQTPLNPLTHERAPKSHDAACQSERLLHWGLIQHHPTFERQGGREAERLRPSLTEARWDPHLIKRHENSISMLFSFLSPPT